MLKRSPTARRTAALVIWLAITAATCTVPDGNAPEGDTPQAPNDAQTTPLLPAIERYLAPYVNSLNFSGTVLVTRGGDTLVQRGWGFANIDARIPAGPDTRYMIGSISKSFTAAAILMLVDRGSLQLDDPVSRYIPDFPRGGAITIHQLLVHSSGLGRFVLQPDYRDRGTRPHTAADLVKWAATIDPVGEPGARVAYSNANYAVLARVIEVASGLDYGEFLRTQIMGPLGLRATAHRGPNAAPIPDLASGYSLDGVADLVPSSAYDYSVMTGAGSLVSTTGDLARWLRLLREGALLSSESTQRMFTEQLAGRGYGWTLETWLGRPVIAMAGWDGVGFSSQLVHFPGEQLTIVVLCNLNVSTLPTEIARNVSAIALGDTPEPLNLRTDRLPDATAFAGTYRFGPDFYVPGTTLTIRAVDGRLMVEDPDGGAAGALLATTDGGFIHRQQWIRLSFTRAADDTGMLMRYGPFEARRE